VETTAASETAPTSVWKTLTSPDLTMLAVVLIWGANFAIIKSALTQIGPLQFTAIRFSLATILLLGLLRWREGDCRFPPGQFWKYLLLGVVGNTIYGALFSVGLSKTTSANASLILASTPAVVAVAAGLLGDEKITPRTIGGVILSFVGVSVVMSGRGARLGSGTLAGDLLSLTAVFCWSAFVLGVRRTGRGVSSLRVTTLTTLTGAPGLVLLAAPGFLQMDWGRVGPVSWFGLLYASGLALVLAYLLYTRSVRLIGGVRTTLYGCAIPVIAALIAWPALGERPSLLHGAGAALIIAGVLVARGGN
jgi:drug/metabolite transporter (DMT)-like permease